MRHIAYLVRCDDNVVAVVLDKKTLASAELEVLQWKHYTRNRTKFKHNFDAYLEAHHWRISEHPVTERVTPRVPFERTHVPETFPQPRGEPLPEQAQLKRKQLPTVIQPRPKVYCPVCESTIRDHHNPGCPEAPKL